MTSRIILLFGGTSNERRVSIASAQHMATYLPKAELWFQAPVGAVYRVEAQALRWHQKPFTEDFALPSEPPQWPDLSAALDSLRGSAAVVFLALHGGDGENGKVQALLEERAIAFTGSGSQASALCFDKIRTKTAVAGSGVLLAAHEIIMPGFLRNAAFVKRLRRRFDEWGGMVLKPSRDGSSVGLHIVRDISKLDAALAAVETQSVPYLAEQYISGRELTVSVLEVGPAVLALSASEVVTESQRVFDFEAKYLGLGTKEVTPAQISPSDMNEAQALAIRVHKRVGAQGYSRSDLMLTPRGLYFLEINTLPGLSKVSFIPQQLAASEMEMTSFITWQLARAQDIAKARVQRG